MARKVHAGMVHINGPSVHDVQTYPHGGFGKSGYGRFNGIEGLREFTQVSYQMAIKCIYSSCYADYYVMMSTAQTRVITINPIREQRLP